MRKILTICLSPVIQKTLRFQNIETEEVNRTSETFTCIAGKGINSARALSQKGLKVGHLTQLGGYNLKWFIKQGKLENIKIHYINSYSDIRNCYTLLTNEGSTTELVEECPKVNNNCEKRLLKKFEKVIHSYDYILLSGSTAKGYSKDVIPQIVKRAKELNKVVILDIVGDCLLTSIKYNPDYIKINQNEFERTFKEEFGIIAEKLYSNGVSLIVTNGIKDIKYFDGKRVIEIETVKNSNPVNTTGCGDSFNAGLIFSLTQGNNLPDSVQTGVYWGFLNSKTILPGDLG